MEIVHVHQQKFEILVSSEQIKKAVESIGNEMNNHFRDREMPPLFICILNGAFMFAADLVRELDFHCNICFVKLASYAGGASTGKVTEVMGLTESIENRDVIIVEDIVDTGLTVENTIETLRKKKPASLSVATVFYKPEAMKRNVELDYVGIELPNRYLVGYGLDFDGLGRQYKDVYGRIDE